MTSFETGWCDDQSCPQKSNIVRALSARREDVHKQSDPDFCATLSREGSAVHPCPPEGHFYQEKGDPMTSTNDDRPMTTDQ